MVNIISLNEFEVPSPYVPINKEEIITLMVFYFCQLTNIIIYIHFQRGNMIICPMLFIMNEILSRKFFI